MRERDDRDREEENASIGNERERWIERRGVIQTDRWRTGWRR